MGHKLTLELHLAKYENVHNISRDLYPTSIQFGIPALHAGTTLVSFIPYNIHSDITFTVHESPPSCKVHQRDGKHAGTPAPEELQ